MFRVDPSPFPAIYPRKNVIAVRERIGKRGGGGGLSGDVPGHSGPTDFMFVGLSVFGYASELTRNKTYSFDQMKSKSFCVMFMRSKREYQMAVCLLSFCFKCTMIVSMESWSQMFSSFITAGRIQNCPLYTLISKHFFQVEYLIIGPIPQNKL